MCFPVYSDWALRVKKCRYEFVKNSIGQKIVLYTETKGFANYVSSIEYSIYIEIEFPFLLNNKEINGGWGWGWEVGLHDITVLNKMFKYI